MKKGLILAPAIAIMAACGGDGGDTAIQDDTLMMGTGAPATTTTTPGTYTDPAVGGTGTMGDTMGMGTTGTMADTMGMGADTVGMGTTRP